jgi:glycosyltransferase involved in cell wall biosynthesis
MSMPLVSVLIPAFNHRDFVTRCLDSVRDETYPAKELVVIDDGSTDGTADVIDAWVARHREVLPIQYTRRGNRGVAATLNELAAHARGDYLRLGASDDYLLPGGLLAQVSYLQTHPHKLGVIGDSIVVDANDRKVHDSGMVDLHKGSKADYASDERLRRAVICQWAVGGAVTLLHRQALEAVTGWRDELRIDDWDFFLRLAARNALGFIDMPVCAYRVHGDNVSHTRVRSARIANLSESRGVALRNAPLFDEPYRTLLLAEARLIQAKLGYLRRNPWHLTTGMLGYVALRTLAATKGHAAHRAVTS